MDNDKWPAFITGFVLGVLVAGGVVGTFAWQQHQQALAARNEAIAERERARAAEQMANEKADQARQDAEAAADNERKAKEAWEEALKSIKLRAGQPADQKDK